MKRTSQTHPLQIAADLDAIPDWGAAAVATLLEQKELTLLRVKTLGEEVVRRGMLWFRAPPSVGHFDQFVHYNPGIQSDYLAYVYQLNHV
jgi:hypothetical protein